MTGDTMLSACLKNMDTCTKDQLSAQLRNEATLTILVDFMFDLYVS